MSLQYLKPVSPSNSNEGDAADSFPPRIHPCLLQPADIMVGVSANDKDDTTLNRPSPLHADVSASDVAATVTPASTTTHLNARSCATCRKRKVRCDRRSPCSNCVKAGIECVFPTPGRAPRRSRKQPDAELLARLRRLEGVVQALGAHIDDDAASTATREIPEAAITSINADTPNTNTTGRSSGQGQSPVSSTQSNSTSHMAGSHLPCAITADPKNLENMDTITQEFGRLVVESETGKSRYVSNKFWSSLSDEVAELRDILDVSDDEDESNDFPSPSGSASTVSSVPNHQGFIFGFSSVARSLRRLHPPPHHISILWRHFKENIDPLVRLLHKPTMEKTIAKAVKNLDNIPRSLEALLFSIYFCSVVSLTQQQCQDGFGEDKLVLMNKFRFGVEQALARAEFLYTQELVTLQALLLFLVCVRRHDPSKFVWTLSGLALRIAMSLGCHRDGTKFGLSPYETELRRRTWWETCILEVRSCEDHGADPMIFDFTFDTHLPSNIYDEDISPDMTEAPKPRVGYTEETFCLVRYEVSSIMRRLNYTPPGPMLWKTSKSKVTTQDREALIEACHKRIEERYLRYCDDSQPLVWVTKTIAHLLVAKMWMLVHHPFLRPDGGSGLDQETKDRLFSTSIEVMEFSHQLETDKATEKWGWLFRAYMQWHAAAYILSELCTRTKGEQVEHAWRAIEELFKQVEQEPSERIRGTLWRPLRKLLGRAQIVRARELRRRATFPEDGSIGPVTAGVLPQGQDFVSATMTALRIPGFDEAEMDSWIAAYNSDNAPPSAATMAAISHVPSASYCLPPDQLQYQGQLHRQLVPPLPPEISSALNATWARGSVPMEVPSPASFGPASSSTATSNDAAPSEQKGSGSNEKSPTTPRSGQAASQRATCSSQDVDMDWQSLLEQPLGGTPTISGLGIPQAWYDATNVSPEHNDEMSNDMYPSHPNTLRMFWGGGGF